MCGLTNTRNRLCVGFTWINMRARTQICMHLCWTVCKCIFMYKKRLGVLFVCHLNERLKKMFPQQTKQNFVNNSPSLSFFSFLLPPPHFPGLPCSRHRLKTTHCFNVKKKGSFFFFFYENSNLSIKNNIFFYSYLVFQWHKITKKVWRIVWKWEW